MPKIFVLIVLTALYWTASVAQAATKYTVQNGAPAPGSAYLDIYVAQRLGFFADEGLDVELRYSANAPQAIQLAASGAVDTARSAIEPYISGYEKGMRGKFYMRSYSHNIFFVAVPDKSDIKRVEDLKGKKIGVVNMGGSALVITRSLLKHAGLPHDNSVFLPVGSGPSALQALEKGHVSALSLWDAAYSALERLGAKFRYFHHPVIGFVGNAGFFMSDASIERRREDHIRFLRAIVKARLWIGRNPDAAVLVYWDAVPNSRFGETPEQQHANALKEITFMNPFPDGIPANQQGRFDFRDAEAYLKVMREEGVTNVDLKVEDVFSNALLDEIGEINVEEVVGRALTLAK